MHFHNRADAGRRLAESLAGDPSRPLVVLGLPRGGLPVAAEVAEALGAPLDLLMVRKLGVPRQPELAMGAIGERGVRVLDDDVLRQSGVTDRELETVESNEREELERRATRYRGGRPPRSLRGCTALVVDDGVATGSTALAAVEVARRLGADRVEVAVPVASRQAVDALSRAADEVHCLWTPVLFHAVGQWYDDFTPTTDEEVVAALERRSGSDGAVY